MKSKNKKIYEPIPFGDFVSKSEEEMELISKNHLLNMKSRHIIRFFE